VEERCARVGVSRFRPKRRPVRALLPVRTFGGNRSPHPFAVSSTRRNCASSRIPLRTSCKTSPGRATGVSELIRSVNRFATATSGPDAFRRRSTVETMDASRSINASVERFFAGRPVSAETFSSRYFTEGIPTGGSHVSGSPTSISIRSVSPRRVARVPSHGARRQARAPRYSDRSRRYLWGESFPRPP
jgi:hypothetical protein